MLSARAIMLLLLATSGCQREPTQLEVTPLAAGEWIVLDHSERGALLLLNHAREPAIRMLTDRLTPVITDTFSLHAGQSIIPMLRIAGGVYYTPRPGGPRLQRSPAAAQRYAFEHENAIWLFQAPDRMHQLTLDEDLDALRAKQREGEVILYWSVDPVWSGDGKFISFLSNREAVRAAQPGQSIWMIDVETRGQRPLYDAPTISAHVDGVFGEEFVFTSSGSPGVFSVHPQSRNVTRLGDGYVMASHEAGAGLLLNDDGRLVLLRGPARDTLPVPPAGHVWSTHAAFSSTADRIALLSTDQAGGYALHILDAEGAVVPSYTLPAPPSYGPAWVTDESLIFTVSERGALQTYRATLR